MKHLGIVTPKEVQTVLDGKLELNRQQRRTGSGNYFVDAVIHELVEKYGENVVYHGGLRIYTSLDTRLQKAGDKALTHGIVPG